MAGKKILVADDSLTIQKVIRLALSNEGYEIQAVSDGNDAIQQISLFRPDLVLIDVSLPGKTAFEVKREINSMSDLEEVRFVLMSSAFEKVDEPQAGEVRFHGRLTKPFDPAHLRSVLNEVLAQVTAKRLEPTSKIELPATPPPLPASPPDVGPPEPAFVAPSVPIMPEPPADSVDNLQDLWTENAGAPPPPTPDSDIKQLTESTIRMSGLDDFNWSVNEPSLKPHPAMMDATGVTFQLDAAARASLGAGSVGEAPPPGAPDLPPPFQPEIDVSTPPELPALGTDLDLDPPAAADTSTLSLNLKPPSMAAASPTDFYTSDAPPPMAGAGDAMEASVFALSQQQMEDMIRKQFQEAFQQMAQKMLPDLAERLIKQEIHRMLSES